MPWPHPAVPSPTLALAGWCPLSPTGAQTTQLLVEPPWRPAVLWDRVTLTCQGSGTAGATTWYKDGQHWGQEGRDHFTVTESGTYTCDRLGSALSPPMSVLHGRRDWLVLQVPARALLEGDTVTLSCRSWENKQLRYVYFYHKEKPLMGPHDGTELSLSPLQLHHSGHYRCKGWVGAVVPQWRESELVTVTVVSPPLPSWFPPGLPSSPCRTLIPLFLLPIPPWIPRPFHGPSSTLSSPFHPWVLPPISKPQIIP
uniref:Uncharacterized protein n=1 Tax=Geospiza parvula TaxID=87175 RepID=A0A8C3NGP0_GEOPR